MFSTTCLCFLSTFGQVYNYLQYNQSTLQKMSQTMYENIGVYLTLVSSKKIMRFFFYCKEIITIKSICNAYHSLLSVTQQFLNEKYSRVFAIVMISHHSTSCDKHSSKLCYGLRHLHFIWNKWLAITNDIGQTMTMIINHKSTALERSATNKRLRVHYPRPWFCSGPQTISYSVCVDDNEFISVSSHVT